MRRLSTKRGPIDIHLEDHGVRGVHAAAFVNGKRVGAAYFEPATNFPDEYPLARPSEYFARSTQIDSAWQRCGVATAIYDAVESLDHPIIPSASLSREASAFWKRRKYPRVFYRGGKTDDSRRIKTGDAFWDGQLFVSSSLAGALDYGPNITTYRAHQDAEILYAGTAEYRRLARGVSGSLLDASSQITQRAKGAGYDAVWFELQGTVGTVILHPERFDVEVCMPDMKVTLLDGSVVDFAGDPRPDRVLRYHLTNLAEISSRAGYTYISREFSNVASRPTVTKTAALGALSETLERIKTYFHGAEDLCEAIEMADKSIREIDMPAPKAPRL